MRLSDADADAAAYAADRPSTEPGAETALADPLSPLPRCVVYTSRVLYSTYTLLILYLIHTYTYIHAYIC